MPKLRCRVCFKVDDFKNMVAPCECYKKRETGLVHIKCLSQLVSRHQHRNDTDGVPMCPVCNKAYKVNMGNRAKMEWGRLMSSRGCDAIFQVVVMVLMIFSLLVVFAVIYYAPEHPAPGHHGQGVSHQEKKEIAFMGVLMIFMVLATLKKVWERLRRVATPIELDEIDF